MAKFDFIQIKFLVKPNRKELIRINKLFSMLDYDFPKNGFTEEGFYGDWRKPILSVQKISNLLHCYGYPNKYRYVEDIYTKARLLEEKSIKENPVAYVHKSYEEYANELMCDWRKSLPKMIDKIYTVNRKNSQYNNDLYFKVKKFSRRFV